MASLLEAYKQEKARLLEELRDIGWPERLLQGKSLLQLKEMRDR